MESPHSNHPKPIGIAQRAINLKLKNDGWHNNPFKSLLTLPAKSPDAKVIIVKKYLEPSTAWAMHEILVLHGGNPEKQLN